MILLFKQQYFSLLAVQANCYAYLPVPVNEGRLIGNAPAAAVGQASRPMVLLLLLLLLDVLSPHICRQRRNGNSSRGCDILQYKLTSKHEALPEAFCQSQQGDASRPSVCTASMIARRYALPSSSYNTIVSKFAGPSAAHCCQHDTRTRQKQSQ
jgi:hypothetical protein